MKKLCLAFLFLSACSLLDSPTEKACTKLVTLCEEEPSEAAKCAADLAEFDKKNNTQAGQKFAECSVSATTCTEMVGCAAGAGASSFMDLGGQFLKGFNKSLGK
jgi:hypothetical protein